MQLANLKAEKKITFEILNQGIVENSDQCERNYNWYWQFDRHNFGINLVKLDTLLFKNATNLCLSSNSEISYQNFAIEKDLEMQAVKETKQ